MTKVMNVGSKRGSAAMMSWRDVHELFVVQSDVSVLTMFHGNFLWNKGGIGG